MREDTRASIKEAAVRLFHKNGFHGTSVRDIAKEARVNISLISYYFGGKRALFELLVTDFFEGYIVTIEQSIHLDNNDAAAAIESVFWNVLQYQQSCHLLARMVHREMTLDSVLVREVMSTYLQKEKYFLESLLKKGMAEGNFKRQPLDLLIVQVRNMMILPFTSPQYLRELFQLLPSDANFMLRYMKHVTVWLKTLLGMSANQKEPVGLSLF
ncbi:forespore capture DNA-binding protein RefZ [Shouchella lonarensis]|uniref:Transcriptional regulator, TetR family n=1 Tax=Shouchella lonarensis TaxID=1464122 RepID=A0A1G6GH51_9BACI|nr:forespore capture DNA-binding protein RefZ [Shouchella lonarensis]SDB81331.1 transcriptional regulator, TetR family [Shouchella lonarensis]